MGDDEEACNTGLGLGLGVGVGVGEYVPKHDRAKKKHVVCLDLSFPLHMKEEAMDAECRAEGSNSKVYEEEEGRQVNNNKKKSNSRKKMRLTKEQSTMLEESFKLHTNLNTPQKQALADRLNLQPRQVEVWFQNRRARTKLKQTEVDCEFLKKRCENLSDENMRLKKELQELRSLKLDQPQFYIQLPKDATLTMCPSCEKNLKSTAAGDAKNAAIIDVVHKAKRTQSGLDGTS
ncbi:hypothetical protein F0562_009112 [Nyssa sinensis]|uniref:Homeobox domain-containing protein n=1 Tax=Nyssa sinensis TaxID=561372 RepID=A0A5J4ZY23_9ASTE|nr:hypothetical protein F0562_009112 [Nyssa sinensis]